LWDRLLCLLPFEPAYFARHGLAADFVGHPVLESGADTGDAARFRAAHAIAPGAPVLILMPGSRRSEVSRLLPIFGQALALLAERIPGIVPVLPVASAVAETVMAAAANWPTKPIIVTDIAAKHDAFAAASAALTKSGTSTLELAMAGVPMAVAYRVNPLTAVIAKLLVRVKYAAMVNLLADREIVPEMIQWTCTPERLVTEISRLLTDPTTAATQRTAFAEVLATLRPTSGKSPAGAAADSILFLLDG
jgi:lipid-A-disaccharide synthase